MADTTTIMVSAETKATLDELKQAKEPYDRLIRRVIKAGSTDPRYVTLRMTPEEYVTLRNRQTWPICDRILVASKQ